MRVSRDAEWLLLLLLLLCVVVVCCCLLRCVVVLLLNNHSQRIIVFSEGNPIPFFSIVFTSTKLHFLTCLAQKLHFSPGKLWPGKAALSLLCLLLIKKYHFLNIDALQISSNPLFSGGAESATGVSDFSKNRQTAWAVITFLGMISSPTETA